MADETRERASDGRPHRLARLVLGSVALLLAIGCGRANPSGTTDPAAAAGRELGDGPAEAPQQVVTRSYEIRLAAQLIGSSQLRLVVHADGRRETDSQMSFSLVRELGGSEDRFHSESSSHSLYDANRQLIADETVDVEAGVRTRERTRFESDAAGVRTMVVDFEGSGFADSRRYPLPADFDDSLAVFERLRGRLAAEGRPVSERFSTFSSTRRAFEPETMTVEGRLRHDYGGEAHDAWRVRSVDASGSVTRALVDADFLPFEVDIEGGFAIRRVEVAPDAAQIEGARISSVLAVDGPVIERWRELSALELVVTVTDDDASRQPIFTTNHYHEVAREGDRYRMTLRSTRLPSTSRPPSLPMSGLTAEVSRFLAATPQSQSDHPEIVEAAAQIAGEERDSLRATQRIVEWVYAELAKEAGARGSATAAEALRARRGDCTEHAALVVALARARQIPARQVSGIVLLPGPDGRMLAGYHAWAEVWVGSWTAVDATIGEVGSSARYLAFGYDEPGEPDTSSALVRTLGRTRIVLGAASLGISRGGS